ncbi:hypothetical protein SAMN05216185_1224 [Pseudomonas guariconensis]|uniref:helix-turn-helix domain-containing protein n=1 Tax=Pseudomonas guariconensis TaxID=1288410 RepID=UPI0008810C92|nr:helix-turn-helix domain-containing protein [Pseudomonas guariconensis]SDE24472.1 hypothetical protein SAMN05216185_1224 [Pseudomonas guariconensis]
MHHSYIYTAVAQPGAGKTQKLLDSLIDAYKATGRLDPTIIALPTLVLIDDIADRIKNLGVPFTTIDHRMGDLVVPKLEQALFSKQDHLVICTQESIRRITPSLLTGWVLVVDELPAVVGYRDYSLPPLELKRVFDYVDERDGQLWITHGMEKLVRKQVATNHADMIGKSHSTLSKSATHIFQMLLSKVDVFIDQPQSNGNRHVRAVEEHTEWWSIMSSADEAHVLAANIEGTEFEIFAEVHGLTLKTSRFQPEATEYKSHVTIYPLTPAGEIFSKQRMLHMHNGQRAIDLVLQAALDHTRTKHYKTKPLLLANNWACLRSAIGVQWVDKDCRGLNNYDQHTDVILLFGGNPSPSDQKGLDYLLSKYGRDFKSAFLTSRLLEPSLQAVTRTAVRRIDNTDHVHLYVQDGRVVDYLLNTYLGHAVVDWSLSDCLPKAVDGRQIDPSTKAEVLRLVNQGVSISNIAILTKISRPTISKWKNQALAA